MIFTKQSHPRYLSKFGLAKKSQLLERLNYLLGIQIWLCCWNYFISPKPHEHIVFSAQTNFKTFITDCALVLVQSPITVGKTWRNLLPSKSLLPLPSSRFLAVGWLQVQGLMFYTTFQWGFWYTFPCGVRLSPIQALSWTCCQVWCHKSFIPCHFWGLQYGLNKSPSR